MQYKLYPNCTCKSAGKPLSRCGKCRRYLKLIASQPPRMHCANCQDTYSLPNGPNIHYRLYNDTIRCPLDHFELVLVTLGVLCSPLLSASY